jgi:hypothetical protein
MEWAGVKGLDAWCDSETSEVYRPGPALTYKKLVKSHVQMAYDAGYAQDLARLARLAVHSTLNHFEPTYNPAAVSGHAFSTFTASLITALPCPISLPTGSFAVTSRCGT